jgi:hypothetical protein
VDPVDPDPDSDPDLQHWFQECALSVGIGRRAGWSPSGRWAESSPSPSYSRFCTWLPSTRNQLPPFIHLGNSFLNGTVWPDWIRALGSEPLHAKMNLISCKSAIFSAKPCSGLQLVSKEFQHPAILTKIEQHFGGFFHQIKVRQPIGRQDSNTNRDLNKQEVELIFA